MNKENKDCCTVCRAEFDTGSGRYLYDDNFYCSTCWNNELVLSENKDSYEKRDDKH